MFKKFLSKKYTKLSLFLALLLISGFTFYYFVRAENPDDDKFIVTGLKVSSIKDGTSDSINPETSEEVWVDPNSYDKATDTNAGNDNSPTNGVVRTFDSVTYNLKFNLSVKDGQTADITSPRNIIIDVIIPGSFDTFLSSDTNSANKMKHTTNNLFLYGEVQFSAVPGNDITRTITLSNIDGNNGTKFEPIFIIREATDTSSKSLSDFSDDDVAGTDFNTSTDFNQIKSAEYCTEGVICNTVITGAPKYSLEVYSAAPSRTSSEYSTTSIATALVLDNDASKGIKGNLIPSTLNYSIKLPSNSETYVYTYNNNIKNYSTSAGDPSIDMGNGVIVPTLSNGEPAGVSADTCDTGNCINVTVNGINSDYQTIENKYYLVTNIFSMNLSRPTGNDADVTYQIVGDINGKSSNVMEITDKVGNYIGEYSSKINLFDTSATVTDDSTRQLDGMAIINTNQPFLIKNYAIYGASSGTPLDYITKYIKIDNDAIKIIDGENGLPISFVNSTREEYDKINTEDIKVSYGFGSWTSQYFEVNSDNAACSNISISNLSKEELMNLYGGPCIRETSNLKWSSDATHTTDEMTDETLLSNGPLVVKVTYGEQNGDRNISIGPGSEITEIVNAKIKNNASLSKTTHQIVTNAITNTIGGSDIYYLSNQKEVSASEMMSNKNNFTMTDYNYTSRTVSSINSAALCESLSCAITGNSILVSPVRVNAPVISSYLDDVEMSDFYYFPIEWRISTSGYYNNTSTSFESASVYVDIPDYLNVINYGDGRTGEYLPNQSAPGYKRYLYSFNQEELLENFGVINFSIYTNIGLNVADGLQPTVYATADYNVSDNANNILSSISPEETRRGYKQVTIHNVSNIGLLGVTAPSYMEKGGTYEYTAIAYNNSKSVSNVNGFTYNNPALYYVLPYNGDSSYKDMSSSFNATKVKFGVTIENLPAGYKAYYTTGSSANIIDSEIDPSKGTVSWVEWSNPTSKITAPTAIKIVKTVTSGTPAMAPEEYFGTADGIRFKVVTTGSTSGDRFYNNFFIITDKPSAQTCNQEMDPYCDTSNKLLFSSSKTLSSIYSRQVSGFVWEDYDYSGLYDNLDEKLDNIPVSICKVKAESYDPENPATYVSDADECVADTTTAEDGSFQFRGLSEGNYYVKYTFDNEKYLVADKRVISPAVPDSNSVNSKASQLPNKNIAVSSVIEFESNNARVNYMNLGLRIKKQFGVDINKYITNVVVSNYNGTNSYDYDNATKVTLNFKNPKDAKIRVTYKFSIENTKYFPGYVGVIADRMPKGMTFDATATENQDWVLFENALYYNGLSGKLLIPGEKYYFTLVLDLDVKEAGSYVNVVAARELVLMGDELPEYDFNNTELFVDTSEQNQGQEQTNTEGGE